MRKFLFLLALVFAASTSSALVLDCSSKQISRPLEEIAIVNGEIQFPALGQESPYEFTIDVLERFDTFKFKRAVFVVDYNKEKKAPRLEVPLMLWGNGERMVGRVSLSPQEAGKHGVILVWEESEWHCESSKYFPLTNNKAKPSKPSAAEDAK